MTIELVPTWTPGDFLRKAREAAGLTQRELAAKMGIDHAASLHDGKIRSVYGVSTMHVPIIMEL